MTDYTTMTLEELEKENLQLTQNRDKILAEQQLIQDEINKRVAEQNAQNTISEMTDEEKEALREALEQTEEE